MRGGWGMDRLRALKALVHDTVDAVTHLVGEGHASAARVAVGVLSSVPELAPGVAAAEDARHLLTEAVLASVRGVNRVVERLTDVGLDAALGPIAAGGGPLLALRGDVIVSPSGGVDQLVGLLNGAVGDHLRRTRSALDLGFGLRAGFGEGGWLARATPEGEVTLSLPPDLGEVAALDGLVVLMHGLGTTEMSFCLDAARQLGDPARNLGTVLGEAARLAPVFARYNTGLPVDVSAAGLAASLSALVAAWPTPVRRIVLVGHSMGGLVVRRALADGSGPWRDAVSDAVTLGSPHEGASLARLGAVAEAVGLGVDLPATRVLGRILEARSAGIRDLEASAPVPFADDVRWTLVAATLHPDPAARMGHPLGDILVTPWSAEGGDAAPSARKVRVGATNHQAMAIDRAVVAAVVEAVTAPPDAASAR
jgi:pimeloyl-ACP methyl ester carboxylesterase